MTDLLHLLDHLAAPRLLVLGDALLDRYTWGDAERVSPEAPVVVLRADAHEARPGGAASVAALLRALGAEVSLAAVAGDDPDGRALRRLLDEAGVGHAALLTDPDRPTTVKERFLGRAAHRHPHPLLRVDHEARHPLRPDLERRLADAVGLLLPGCGALLVSDYAKGVCTPELLFDVFAVAAGCGVPVLVDPARIVHYGRYRGAALLAPNRAEAELATGRTLRTPADGLTAARRLGADYEAGAVVVKLDSDGMALARAGEPGRVFPTRARAVYDVTGAGDMVLAVLGLCRAGGVEWEEAVALANLAAGLEVEQWGVTPVTRDQLRAEILRQQTLAPGLSACEAGLSG